MHSVNTMEAQKVMLVLADSEIGAAVITKGFSIFGTSFNMEAKHKSSWTILANFIERVVHLNDTGEIRISNIREDSKLMTIRSFDVKAEANDTQRDVPKPGIGRLRQAQKNVKKMS